MSPTHLLDTSVYCQPLRPRPLESTIRRWREIGDSRLCTSVLCEAEVLQGLEAKGSPRFWDLYDNSLKGRLPLLALEHDAAVLYGRLSGRLMKLGKRKPVMDLLIAVSALSHGMILATCNVADFMGIEGLAVEDWST